MASRSEQFNVNLAMTADTSQAKRQLNDLRNTLKDLTTDTLKNSSSLGMTKELKEANKLATELQAHLKLSMSPTGNLDLTKFSQSLANSKRDLADFERALRSLGPSGDAAFKNLVNSINNAEIPIKRTNGLLKEFGTTLANTAKWEISSKIMHGLESSISQAFSYAKNLDESLTNIRIVTGQTADQMAAFAERANHAAQSLNTTTTAYTNASLIFYQQGLNDKQVEERTNMVIKMAQATGDASEQVSSYMTAIWNNFDDGSKSLEHYGDVIAKLGATTASSSSEISQGLSKFAAIANTTGLSYEYATSALATLVANTRESADTIGNSLKTIFARIQGLQLGETLEDGVDLDKYSKALKTIGVNVLDMNGQLRDADSILADMAVKWGNLERAQKVALAKTVAGTRQYSMLTSLMENWGDMEKNLQTAGNAEGTLQNQADIYAESWEASQKRVQAAMESIYSSLIDEDFFKELNNFFTGLLKGVKSFIDSLGGIKGVISGLGVVITNVFGKQIADSINQFSNNTETARQKTLEFQRSANQLLLDKSNATKGTSSENPYENIYGKRNELQMAFIDNAKMLNEVELETARILMTQNEELEKEAANAQKLKDQAIREQGHAQTRVNVLKNDFLKDASGRKKTNFNTNYQEFERHKTLSVEADDLIRKYKELSDSSSTTEQQIEKLREAFKNVNTEIANGTALGNPYDLLKEGLRENNIDKIAEAFAQIENKVVGIKVNLQDFIHKMAVALVNSKKFSGTVEDAEAIFKDLVAAEEQVKEKTSDANHEMKKYGEHVNQVKAGFEKAGQEIKRGIGDSIMDLSRGLSQAFMIMNSIKSLGSVWASPEEDVDTGEKIYSSLMSISMILPQIISLGKMIKAEFGAIGAALALVTTVTIGAAMAVSEAQKQIRQNEEKAFQENLSKYNDRKKEIDENGDLVHSYDELYEKYKKTGEGKDELNELSEKIIDTYGIERTALSTLRGEYEDFGEVQGKVLQKRRTELETEIANLKTLEEEARDNFINEINDKSSDGLTGDKKNDKVKLSSNFIYDRALDNEKLATKAPTLKSFIEEGAIKTGVGVDDSGYKFELEFDINNSKEIQQTLDNLKNAKEELSGLGYKDEYLYTYLDDWERVITDKYSGLQNLYKDTAKLEEELNLIDEMNANGGIKNLDSYIKWYEKANDNLKELNFTSEETKSILDEIISTSFNPLLSNFEQARLALEQIEKINPKFIKNGGYEKLSEYLNSEEAVPEALGYVNWEKITVESFETAKKEAENYVNTINQVNEAQSNLDSLKNLKDVNDKIKGTVSEDDVLSLANAYDWKPGELEEAISKHADERSEYIDQMIESEENKIVKLTESEVAQAKTLLEDANKVLGKMQEEVDLRGRELLSKNRDIVTAANKFQTLKDEYDSLSSDEQETFYAENENTISEIIKNLKVKGFTDLSKEKFKNSDFNIFKEGKYKDADSWLAQYEDAEEKVKQLEADISDGEHIIQITPLIQKARIQEQLDAINGLEIKVGTTLDSKSLAGLKRTMGKGYIDQQKAAGNIGYNSKGELEILANGEQINDDLRKQNIIDASKKANTARWQGHDAVASEKDRTTASKNQAIALADTRENLLQLNSQATFDELLDGLKEADGYTDEWKEHTRELYDLVNDDGTVSLSNVLKLAEEGSLEGQELSKYLKEALDTDANLTTQKAIEGLNQLLADGSINAQEYKSYIDGLLNDANSSQDKLDIIDKSEMTSREKSKARTEVYSSANDMDDLSRLIGFETERENLGKDITTAMKYGDTSEVEKIKEDLEDINLEELEIIKTTNQLTASQKEAFIMDMWEKDAEHAYIYAQALEAIEKTQKDIALSLGDMKIGDIINKEDMASILELSPELAGFFQQQLDGSYKLVGGLEQVRQAYLNYILTAQDVNGQRFFSNDQIASALNDLSELQQVSEALDWSDNQYDDALSSMALKYQETSEAGMELYKAQTELARANEEVTQKYTELQFAQAQQGFLNTELSQIRAEAAQKAYEEAEAIQQEVAAKEELARINAELALESMTQAEAYNLDREQLEALADYYLQLAEAGVKGYEALKGSAEAAVDLARTTIRVNEGVSDLSKNYTKYSTVLSKVQKGQKSVEEVLLDSKSGYKELSKTLSNLLNVSEDSIDTAFMQKVSLEDLSEAAKGNTDAIGRMKDAWVDYQGEVLGVSQQGVNEFKKMIDSTGEMNNFGNPVEGQDQIEEVYLTLQDDEFVNKMAQDLIDSQATAEQIQAAFSGIGIEMDNVRFFTDMDEAEKWAKKKGNQLIEDLSFDAKPQTDVAEQQASSENVTWDEEITYEPKVQTSYVLKDGDDKPTPVTQRYYAAHKSVNPQPVTMEATKQEPIVALGLENAHTGAKSGGNITAPSGGGGRGGGGGGGGRGRRSTRRGRRVTATRAVDTSHQGLSNLGNTNKSLTSSYDKLSKASNNAFGASKLRNMDKEIDKQKEIINNLKKMTSETKKLMDQEKARLSGKNEDGTESNETLSVNYTGKQLIKKKTKSGKKKWVVSKNEKAYTSNFKVSDILGAHTEKNQIQLDEAGNIITETKKNKKGKKVKTPKKQDVNYENIELFDENGNLQNEAEVEKRLQERENKAQALVDLYANDKDTSKRKRDAEKELNRIKQENQAIRDEKEKYKQDYEAFEEYLEAQTEARLEKEAKELEKIEYKMNLKVEINDEQLQRLDKKLERTSLRIPIQLGDGAYTKTSVEDKNQLGSLEFGFDEKGKPKVIGGSGKSYLTYNKVEAKYQSAINTLKANGLNDEEAIKFLTTGKAKEDEIDEKTWKANINQDEMEYLTKLRSEVMDLKSEWLSYNDEMSQIILNTMQEWLEATDIELSKIETNFSKMEHIANVIDIVGSKTLGVDDNTVKMLKKNIIEQKKIIADGKKELYEQANSAYENARNKYEKLQEEYKNATEGSAAKEELKTQVALAKQSMDQILQEAQSKMQDWNSAVEDCLQNIRDTYIAIMDTFIKSQTKAITDLQELRERHALKDEGMLDETTKIYNLTKLTKDINDSINDSNNIKGKQSLQKILDKVNQAKEKGVEISEYEAEALRKEYEIELARLALEEARGAKSEVRLTKDSEGNFSYIYTANQDDLDKAESEYQDKLQEAYEYNKEYINETQDLILSYEKELNEKIQEIYESDLTDDEKRAKIDETTEFYSNLIKAKIDGLNLGLKNQSDLYENYYKSLKEVPQALNFIDTWAETDLSKLDGITKSIGDFEERIMGIINSIKEEAYQNLEDWNEDNTDTLEREGSYNNGTYTGDKNSTDLTQNIQDIAKSSSDVYRTVTDMAQKASQSMAEANTAVANWIDGFTNNFNAINAMVSNMDTNLFELRKDLGNGEENQQTLYDQAYIDAQGNNEAIAKLNEGYAQKYVSNLNDNEFLNINESEKSVQITDSDVIADLRTRGVTDKERQKEILTKIKELLEGKGYTKVTSLTGARYKLGFDTGGYTGSWTGREGKLAFLHQKELVLNKEDTSNILSAVSAIRDISKAIDLNALSSQSGLLNLAKSVFAPANNQNDVLEQYVTITLDAPNLTNKNEVIEAFDNVINLAAQYAHVKRNTI